MSQGWILEIVTRGQLFTKHRSVYTTNKLITNVRWWRICLRPALTIKTQSPEGNGFEIAALRSWTRNGFFPYPFHHSAFQSDMKGPLLDSQCMISCSFLCSIFLSLSICRSSGEVDHAPDNGWQSVTQLEIKSQWWNMNTDIHYLHSLWAINL